MATKDVGDEAIKQRILRLTDVAQEPLQFLSPIGGYEEMPVVSLEQAVEKLVHLLPAVQSHAYIAKQRCKKPADGLSQDESASIMLYTMGWRPLNKCLYVVLNATLRSADREKLEPWLLYLRLFVSGLSRLPPVRETVYRGVKLDLSREYIKGETIIWWGFSSCTTDVTVLQSELFLGKEDTRTMFAIKCESARDIQKHSYYPTENEMLLLAATQFQVTGCLDQGALRIIQLKETQPPFPLLQPVPLIPQSTELSFSSVSTYSQSASTAPAKKTVTASVVKPSTVLSSPPKYRNAKLKKTITENKSNSELDLSDQNLTDEDMKIVAYYALQNNKTLTHLYLSENQIGDQGAQHLAEALKHNTTLTVLYIFDNEIGDEGARYISEALRHNTALTVLSLESSHITDKGAKYLAESLRYNKTLKQLFLYNNLIGDQGAQYLSDASRHNTTLIKLTLDMNKITNNGVQYLTELQKKNTNLKVTW